MLEAWTELSFWRQVWVLISGTIFWMALLSIIGWSVGYTVGVARRTYINMVIAHNKRIQKQMEEERVAERTES